MATESKNPSAGISTSVEAPESWKRVVKVEIDRARFDKEYDIRLRKAAKSHQKPGFRKGKTPRAVVEREMGDYIRTETVEDLVPKAWMSAVLEHKLAPVNDPALENLDFADEGPLKFDLVIEVRPEITLGDLEAMPVRKRAVEVKDQEIDDVLTRLQDSRATYEKVDRSAAEDDQILLDLIPRADSGDFDEAGKIPDQRFILGSAGNMAAFNEQLVGCQAGDVKVVGVEYPEDHPNEKLRGQTMDFECHVREIAAKALPALDDDFAATVQDGKTMAEVRDEIRADLEKEATRKVEQELDRQVREELVRRHDVVPPPSMVERYLASGLEDMNKRNTQMGHEVSEEEKKEYLEAGKPHAQQALQAMLLMEAVRSQEDIKVAPEDVDERIEEIALENGFDVDRYREFVKSGEEAQRLEYDLLERRTFDFLLSRAEITEVAADTDVFAE